jgi:glutamine amidotransferase-like uncharacterized protein
LRNLARPTVGLFSEGTAIGSFLPTLRGIFGEKSVFEMDMRDMRSQRTLKKFDIVVAPGVPSEDSHYLTQVFDGNAKSAIVAEVHDGLRLLASCAAFYAFSSDFSYQSVYKKVSGRKGLGLLDGRCRGPVDADMPFATEIQRFSGTRLVMVDFNDAAGREMSARICYSNGPSYEPGPGEAIDVIARYAEMKDRPIAACAKDIGKGIAVFSGVLPEIAPDELMLGPREEEKYPILARLRRDSLPHAAGRKALMNSLISRLVAPR